MARKLHDVVKSNINKFLDLQHGQIGRRQFKSTAGKTLLDEFLKLIDKLQSFFENIESLGDPEKHGAQAS